jgi:hypothetical protein
MLPYHTLQSSTAPQLLCSHEAAAKVGGGRDNTRKNCCSRKIRPRAKEDLTINLTELSSKLDDKSIPFGQSMVGQAVLVKARYVPDIRLKEFIIIFE